VGCGLTKNNSVYCGIRQFRVVLFVALCVLARATIRHGRSRAVSDTRRVPIVIMRSFPIRPNLTHC